MLPSRQYQLLAGPARPAGPRRYPVNPDAAATFSAESYGLALADYLSPYFLHVDQPAGYAYYADNAGSANWATQSDYAANAGNAQNATSADYAAEAAFASNPANGGAIDRSLVHGAGTINLMTIPGATTWTRINGNLEASGLESGKLYRIGWAMETNGPDPLQLALRVTDGAGVIQTANGRVHGTCHLDATSSDVAWSATESGLLLPSAAAGTHCWIGEATFWVNGLATITLCYRTPATGNTTTIYSHFFHTQILNP